MQSDTTLHLAVQDKFDTTMETFLLEDYKQKISYLTAHLTRMWTRFNFFLTAQVALVAFMFTSDRDISEVALPLIVIEIVISLIWYVFGAQDRFLFRMYRYQVEETAQHYIKAKLGMTSKEGLRKLAEFATENKVDAMQLRAELEQRIQEYHYTSETYNTEKRLKEKDKQEGKYTLWSHITQFRVKKLGITRLAAVVPLLVFFGWMICLLVGIFIRFC